MTSSSVEFKTKDGTVYHLVYVVIRPGFLEAVLGQYTQWQGAGGKGMRFGRTALADEKAFGRAGDLLYFLIHQRGGPYLLSRSVERDGDTLRWTGHMAHFISSPTSDRDWRFERIVITANVATGAVEITTAPGP